MHSHEQIDRRSLAMGCAVADQLEHHPELLEVARVNLSSWIDQSHGVPLQAHLEWRDLIERLPLASLLELLRSDSEEARRLRQSSPFAGVISQEERWRILREYEKTPA